MATMELKVLQKLSEYEFGAEVWIMRSGINRNKWSYQNVDKYYKTFAGVPILCAYANGKIGLGHEMEEKVNGKGERYYSFTAGTSERIVGTISDDLKDIRLEEKDGETWVIAKGRLFKFYAPELVDKIVSQGVMEVSAETSVTESYMDGDVEVFTSWEALGVTILGDNVAPAIPGANIKRLAEMREEFNSVLLKAASYRSQAEEDIDEPDDVDDVDEEDDDIDHDADDDPDDDIDEETNKPQNQNNSKGETDMQVFNKRQMAEIAPTFEGYTVMAAGQDEAGYHFGLVAENGTTAVYSMNSLDDVIDAKKIAKFNAQVTFEFGEDSRIAVDYYEMTDALGDALVKANAEAEDLSKELKSAQETIEAMKASEHTRRISAAKAAAKSTLESFNENREEKVDETVLNEINEQIDDGAYSDCVNGEGEWCGEEVASHAVLSKCAEEVMKYDKARMARNSKHYIWESATGKDGASTDDVSALIAKWKAKKI